MYVHVVGFHPASGSLNAVGGFEWRYSRQEAVKELMERVLDDDPGQNLVLARIEVPFEVNSARPREYDDREAEITSWLDANLFLFELPLQ